MKLTALVGADRISVVNRLRAACLTLALLVSSSAIAATTLEKIAQDGAIKLGYQIAPPFSYLDEAGNRIGYSIDICMKVVDAIKRDLKRPDLAVKFVPVTSVTRYPALIDGRSTSNVPTRQTGRTTADGSPSPFRPSGR